MTNERFEKLMLLSEKKLTQEDTDFIRSCLSDLDLLTRSEAAAFILNSSFSNDEDVETLLKMCGDEESLVRIEVYDALSRCIGNKVTNSLKQAIISESDEIARSYSITAWADTITNHAHIHQTFDDEIEFIKRIQIQPIIQNSEHCKLSCCYALYRFQYPKMLEAILSFLNSEDYRIQCSVINYLSGIVRKEDILRVKAAFELHLETKPVKAVSSTIDKFLYKYSL